MLNDFINLATRLTRDDTGTITDPDVQDAVRLAVVRYSKDRPQIAVEDVTADGTNFLPLPTTWVQGFSDVRQIEYPIGDIPPTLMEAHTFEVYQAPSGEQLLVLSAPASGDSVRVTSTLFHQVDITTDTVPVADREAVCSFAAALLCDQLVSQFSGDSDSTIRADAVDHNAKASQFRTRATTLRKRYYDELGVDPKRNQAAGVVVDLDGTGSWGGDRLTHPRWRT